MHRATINASLTALAMLVISLPASATIEFPSGHPAKQAPTRHPITQSLGHRAVAQSANHPVPGKTAHHLNPVSPHHPPSRTANNLSATPSRAHRTAAHTASSSRDYLVPPPPPYSPDLTADTPSYADAGSTMSAYDSEPAQSGRVSHSKHSRNKLRGYDVRQASSQGGYDTGSIIKKHSLKHRAFSTIAKGFKFLFRHAGLHKQSQT